MLNRDLYTNVHMDTVHSSQKVEKPKHPSMDEWINKLRYIHTMVYYSAMKRSEALILTTITERPITQHWYRCYTIYYMTQRWKEGFLGHWDLHVIHLVQFSHSVVSNSL